MVVALFQQDLYALAKQSRGDLQEARSIKGDFLGRLAVQTMGFTKEDSPGSQKGDT